MRRLHDPARLRELLGVPFSAEQLAAISAPLEPAVVVAGAGTGKTTVMAARVVWLVTTGAVAADQVLGLTFTNKAAAELGSRIRDALALAGASAPEDEPAGDPTVATYHSFAGQLLAEHGLRIAHEPDAVLLADARRHQLAIRAIRGATGPFRYLSSHLPTTLDALLSLEGELLEHLVTPQRLRDSAGQLRLAASQVKQTKDVTTLLETLDRREELLQLVEAYRGHKRRRGVIEFADQMSRAAELARAHPDVGEALRARYRIVLLDEYQDTSVAQQQMLSSLFVDGHAVTAVGDPCQAIYGWRGASVANIDRFATDFPRADGTAAMAYPLTSNRRSGHRVLAAANRLAARLRDLHPSVEPLCAPDGAGPGELRCALHATHAQEVDATARAVADLHAQEGRDWGDMAVLTRTGTDLALVHRALVAREVPVQVVGLDALLDLPEIADVVALLEVLDDATANPSLVRLLTGPRWRIGARDLALLGRRGRELVRADHDAAARRVARQRDSAAPVDAVAAALNEAVDGVDVSEMVSLLEAMENPGDDLALSPQARERFAAFAAELRQLRRRLGDPVVDVVHAAVQTCHLDVELAATPEAVAAQRRDSISTLMDVAASFVDVDADASLGAFLSYLRSERQHGHGQLSVDQPQVRDAVTLLTVHRAKGLEWPVVVLPFLSAGVFPSEQPRPLWVSAAHALPVELRGDTDTLPDLQEISRAGVKAYRQEARQLALDEELRLGYVAVTRAKELLVASGHWWGPRQKKPRGPSPYLLTLREEAARIGPWVDEPGEVNPVLEELDEPVAWPVQTPGPERLRRAHAAAMVEAAWQQLRRDGADHLLERTGPANQDSLADVELVSSWDAEADRLLAEVADTGRAGPAGAGVEVVLPESLSTSQLQQLSADPQQFAAQLARPLPRPPTSAARRGNRFHEWVESRLGQLALLEPDELTASDAQVDDGADLQELVAAFLRGAYAERPVHRVEWPFQLRIGATVVRGRIDAVYQCADGTWEVVDWKTGPAGTADPLQLAVYRLAWARDRGVAPEQVRARFVHVRTGEVVEPETLPDEAMLAALLT